MDPYPIKSFPTCNHRAWFEHGGYKSFPTFKEACAAGNEERGDVVRVDRCKQEILWTNPHKDMD